MIPTIKTIADKKLIGKRLLMSFANNITGELWKSFMPHRKEIINAVSPDLYSMQLYAPGFFDAFDIHTEFEKWATLEVTDLTNIPTDMEPFTLPGGLYAVFDYKGRSSDGASVFQYILGTWLPNSEYALDQRPHFEILGEKYKNDDPDSEEEIWIPVKLKV